MVRLEPMDSQEFDEFAERSIPRRAAKWVARGIWTEARALEASRQLYSLRLPFGRGTPGNHFLKIVDEASAETVGETWYHAEEQGGKLQFWVEWIEIRSEHRRKGYATQALRALEETARRLGADRVGLTVWTDNPNAMRLYEKLGFAPASVNMTKRLASEP